MRSAIRSIQSLVLVVAVFLTGVGRAQITPTPVPSTRTALLMGAWDYTDDTFPALPERGIEGDLTRMEARLKELGFDVTVVRNPSLSEAKKAVDNFGAVLKARGGASLFYFTGHGAEHEGRNFLIPKGTNIQVAEDLDDEALSANRVLDRMEQSGIRVNLVFLDCCRNPLTKSSSETGLAAMSAKGALIGFATRSGDVADASDDGSPYTNALLKHLGQPGISLPDMHTLVTQELENSGSKRRPGQYVDLGGIFHLVPSVAATPAEKQVANAAVTSFFQRITDMIAPAPTPKSTSILDQGEVGKVIQVKLPGDVLMKFCYCPPGSFMRGSPKSEADREEYEDQVSVRISKAFWAGQVEVTQGQWKALMDGNPSKFQGDDLPVDNVVWDEAQAFITKLNQSVKLPAGWRYSLLTDAQWEYACRAGTESVFHYGNTLTRKQANIYGNEDMKDTYLEKTAKVGSYQPNAWGLYDMHGNVWEWCLDAADASLKLPGGTDPVGNTGSYHVIRGGAWFDRARSCRSAFRAGLVLRVPLDGITGFRVAAVPAQR